MIIKRNTYKNRKDKKTDLEKRISYIHLKYNLDQTLQEINKTNLKRKSLNFISNFEVKTFLFNLYLYNIVPLLSLF